MTVPIFKKKYFFRDNYVENRPLVFSRVDDNRFRSLVEALFFSLLLYILKIHEFLKKKENSVRLIFPTDKFQRQTFGFSRVDVIIVDDNRFRSIRSTITAIFGFVIFFITIFMIRR